MSLPGIFAFVGNELVNKRGVTIITSFKTYEKVIITFCDNEGNLKLKTDSGTVLLQRKYISSIEIDDQELLEGNPDG